MVGDQLPYGGLTRILIDFYVNPQTCQPAGKTGGGDNSNRPCDLLRA